MPKVQCLRIPGVTCWFWSHDHRPPHFHAKRAGKWEVRVYFLENQQRMIEVKWIAPGARFDMANDLCKLAHPLRDELLREWENKVNCDDNGGD